ncbi:MAG TPA: HYR domain-containing protein, partial [Verrucomicrobiae bacterium]
NCAVTNVICNPNGGTFAVGATPVTCTARDASGNSASCAFTVTINDTEPPLLTCPGDIVANADPGQCSKSNLTYSASATDNCAVTNVSCSPNGGTFAVGATPVTCTARDASGNRASCTFTVTINDIEPPLLTCPGDIVANADPGQCGKSNLTYSASATDNCAVVSVDCNPASGSTFPKGVSTVTCTVSDGAGNTNRCSFTVTVNDVEPPRIICAADMTAVWSGTNGAQVFFSATATDNCDASVAVTCTPASGSYFPVGTNAVICIAADDSGKTNICSFTVTVTDPTPPVLSIEVQGRDVVICWPQTFTSYALHKTTELADNINWSPVSALVTREGNRYCVSLPTGGGNLFFRLKSTGN